MIRSPTLPPAISSGRSPIPLTAPHLRLCASWIRDELDPIISRDGPEVLHPDDVLTLHELFLRLAAEAGGLPLPINPVRGTIGTISYGGAEVTSSVLRYSRMHCAVLEICGKATRWPGRLADECDILVAVWNLKFGQLALLRPFLFGQGGRLTGVCGTSDTTRNSLLKLWSYSCPDKLQPGRAKKHGHLELKPGAWWINGMFACHAGCIDLDSAEGGICFDENGAYAVILRDNSEVEGSSPEKFTYRCGRNDKGRYRLTSADFKSRFPIRIFRSHTLNSLWAPKVGMRYDGLHRVKGWAVKPNRAKDANDGELIWEITFERESNQVPMETVLKHPLAEEVDDYMEYKRLRMRRHDNPDAMKNIDAVISTPIPEVMLEIPPPLIPTGLELAIPDKASSLRSRGSHVGSHTGSVIHSPRYSEALSQQPTPRQTFEPARFPGLNVSLASSPASWTLSKHGSHGEGSSTGAEAAEKTSTEFPKRMSSSLSNKPRESKPPSRGSIFAPAAAIKSRLSITSGGSRKPSVFTKLFEGLKEGHGLKHVEELPEKPEKWETQHMKKNKSPSEPHPPALPVVMSPREYTYSDGDQRA